MRRSAIERKIKYIKMNIDYYSKVYNPNLKKISELKKKLQKYIELLDKAK